MNKQFTATYSRVSTKEQAIDGLSLIKQGKDCRDFITKNESWELKFELVDDGYSGKDENRPNFQKLVSLIKEGKIDNLIVWATDRLFRNLQKQLGFYELLESHNVKLFSVKEPGIGGNNNKLYRNILGAFAEHERDMIKMRTIAGKRQAILQGEWQGASPYGYKQKKVDGKIIDGRLIIDSEKAKWVLKIFQLYSNGLSYGKVAKRLNELGVPTSKSWTKKEYSRQWGDSAIKKIICNDIYMGSTRLPHYADKAEQMTYKCPVIIEKELWEQANSIRKNKSEWVGESKYNYFYTNMIRCMRCGKKLYGETKMRGENFTKIAYSRRDKTCEGRGWCGSISERVLNRTILPSLHVLCLNPKAWQQFFAKDNTNKEELEGKIKEEKTIVSGFYRKLKLAEDSFLETLISKTSFRERKIELEGKVKAHLAIIGELEDKIKNSDERQVAKKIIQRRVLDITKDDGKDFFKKLAVFGFSLIDTVWVNCKEKRVMLTLKISSVPVLELDLGDSPLDTAELYNDPVIYNCYNNIYQGYLASDSKCVGDLHS